MNKWLFVVICILFFVAVGNSFYTFYYTKDYNFTVEASCGEGKTCFARSCDSEDCPPNGLEVYRIFNLRASDFEKCADDSCINACTTGLIECSEVLCGDSEGDSCATINSAE